MAKQGITFKCSDASSWAFSCCYGNAQLISSQPDNFIHLAPASCQSHGRQMYVCCSVYVRVCARPEAIDKAVRERMRHVYHRTLSLILSVALLSSLSPSLSLCALDRSVISIPYSSFITPHAHLHHPLPVAIHPEILVNKCPYIAGSQRSAQSWICT